MGVEDKKKRAREKKRRGRDVTLPSLLLVKSRGGDEEGSERKEKKEKARGATLMGSEARKAEGGCTGEGEVTRGKGEAGHLCLRLRFRFH